MKASWIMNRITFRLGGLALLALMAANVSAQVTNIWSLKHPPGFTATYFDNMDFTAPRLTLEERYIDSNVRGFAYNGTNTFSVRWVGRMMPFYSESYRFHAVADDGIRVWVNDQLIIDAWFDQEATEHTSAPIPLTAGVEISIRVDYYQNSGSSTARLLCSSTNQAKEVGRYICGTPAPLLCY